MLQGVLDQERRILAQAGPHRFKSNASAAAKQNIRAECVDKGNKVGLRGPNSRRYPS